MMDANTATGSWQRASMHAVLSGVLHQQACHHRHHHHLAHCLLLPSGSQRWALLFV
jgi:hypothetical protein